MSIEIDIKLTETKQIFVMSSSTREKLHINHTQNSLKNQFIFTHTHTLQPTAFNNQADTTIN